MIRILLVAGKITTCIVANEEGTVVGEGQDVLNRLKRLGQLDWTWQPIKEPTITALSPIRPFEQTFLDRSRFIYTRVIPLEAVPMAHLSRKHRQVLLVVDGLRTATQIAHMFSSSPAEREQILKILDELRQQGLLAIASTNQ